jgi:hypothetical protein
MARTTPRLEPVKRSRGDVQLELHLRIGGRHSLRSSIRVTSPSSFF